MPGANKKRQQQERRANATRDNNNSPPNGSGASPSSTTASSKSNGGRQSPPSRFDGNRDPSTTPGVAITSIQNKNIDIGGAGAGLKLPERPPGLNTSGREVAIKLNTFHVQEYPQKPVYQYDVFIGGGDEKPALNNKCWRSARMQQELGKGWIYDGKRLAWSHKKVDHQIRVPVDTDEVDGKPTGAGGRKREVINCNIRFAKTINFTSLTGYLNRQSDNFNVACLECINFLDHLMREQPSQKYIVQKRSFFARGAERFLLGGGVEAMKGVYASMRLAHPKSLSVNVDVANTAFWTETQLNRTAMQILNTRDATNDLTNKLKAGGNQFSPGIQELSKLLKRVAVYTTHIKGQTKEEAQRRPQRIEGFLNQTSKQCMLKAIKLDESSPEKDMSLYEYFQRRYNIRLQCPDLPVVKMSKKIKNNNVILPMELCHILGNQRYGARLNESQTTNMLKFAVTIPPQRWTHIEEGLKLLDWKNDIYLKNYGLRVSDTPTTVNGRVLNPPKVAFGQNGSATPGTSGRWDLRGKKFFEPFKQPLNSWGFCIVPSQFGRPIGEEQLKPFIRTFVGVLEGHGCRVLNKEPVILTGVSDPGKCVEELRTKAGNQVKQLPQILFFVVANKNADVYRRLKKSADCRFGIPSQVIQGSHVQKNAPQYCSNVAMKVNAKLGGTTCRAIGAKATVPGSWFKAPTMIIGADVSHPSVGFNEEVASIAAFTMSYDRHAAKYISRVDTNGHRIEMIMKENIDNHLKKMTEAWMADLNNKKMPAHVIYMRDGVSEGQYAQVLHQEMRDIQAMFESIDSAGARQIKYTVIVCTKRHHVRFFPGQGAGDKNSNALPGTLVETGVTHPREYDFYLCAHSAIKGTARPVHYQILRDDTNMKSADLQALLYENSYQYMRSTTPVSLFPAIYYADIAAARGIAHLNQAGVHTADARSSSSGSQTIEIKKTLPMAGDLLWKTMWFV